MPLEYTIDYKAENQYDHSVNNAVWQFLIIPEDNDNQQVKKLKFSNSLNSPEQYSLNAFGFRTLRVHSRGVFDSVLFEASFQVLKDEVNPFDFLPSLNNEADYARMESLGFQVDFEPFLRKTVFTTLPASEVDLFRPDRSLSVFANLQELNRRVSGYLKFRAGVTDVTTTLDEIIAKRQGVCQDYTHFFCALARENHIPARYVSGYLNQGNGYLGDSQMHAWAEAFVPDAGWVGFDPTNNLLVGTNHIKVAHGKDYGDCAPLKGIIYAPGNNETSYSVQVSAQQ